MISALLLVAAKTPSFLKPIGKIFEPLVKLLHWVLVVFHNGAAHLTTGAAWGLAIIGLTIVVRLILMPLTFRQFRSAQAMAALQPHLKELQRKYKGDKQKLQQETMRLYQANKVNPFASCLPLILQIPVFISLYWAIRGASYLDPASTRALHDASFLWLNHLGKPDTTYILLILYVVSQLVSTELMMTPSTDKQQKWLMRAMPSSSSSSCAISRPACSSTGSRPTSGRSGSSSSSGAECLTTWPWPTSRCPRRSRVCRGCSLGGPEAEEAGPLHAGHHGGSGRARTQGCRSEETGAVWQDELSAGRQAGFQAGRQTRFETGRQTGLEAGR